MLPIDWQFWGIFSVPLILIASAAIGFKYAGRVRVGILRWSLRSLCVPLGLIGSLAAMLLVAGRGCASYSPLIYSPTGTFAARIELDDYGATGGDESVDLFWARGLMQSTVFAGDWGTVEPSDVRWKSDSELLISYDGRVYNCKSTSAVKVTCSPKHQ